MPKKPQRQQVTEAQLIAWYKWEFLRRNPEYRKDYDEFTRQFGSWLDKHGYWYDHAVPPWGHDNLRFFASVVAPKAKVICEHWQIRDPLPPDWEFEKSGSRFYNADSEVFLPTDCSKEEAGQGWDLPDFTLSELIQRAPESTAVLYGPKPDHMLELQFDLRQPLDFLLRDADGRIRSRKWKYNRAHPPTKPGPQVRRRLCLYDTYLKVWDLRTAGEKYEVIAALVFPGKPSPVQNARDSFKRAKALVHVGYKELR